ncbi:MAG TPA: 2OG-Fe(II) oxygenase [Oleiagrimonas sp.]|nr:2OG-Fe(II) oxygenase [Oleiagrimonas sp.]
MTTTLLSASRFDRPDTLVFDQPFAFMIAHGVLPSDRRAVLSRDFPHYAEAGFFPYDENDCGPAIRNLVKCLIGTDVARAIGQRLQIDNLDSYPTLVTLCRSLNLRHGTIHTDSKSKVATALLYLNERWPDSSDGCLRFLRSIDDIDTTVSPEVKPLYGEFVAFRRADNSFHGHLPFEGERRVIQVAWLVDEEAKLRKTQRGHWSRLFKKLSGGLDRRIGAKRKRNASHQ